MNMDSDTQQVNINAATSTEKDTQPNKRKRIGPHGSFKKNKVRTFKHFHIKKASNKFMFTKLHFVFLF